MRKDKKKGQAIWALLFSKHFQTTTQIMDSYGSHIYTSSRNSQGNRRSHLKSNLRQISEREGVLSLFKLNKTQALQ